MKNPIKFTIKTEIVPAVFLILGIVLSFYFYTNFPDRVATHWNAQGYPDGYSSKIFAAFFFPLLNISIYLLMLFVPYADPRKKNYKKFANVYHLVKGALIIFISVIYIVVGLNGLGYKIPVNFVVPISVGMLFIVIGAYLSQVKPNWFFGIRTPWTLSSDRVWEKTHKYGSKIFIAGGILMVLGALYPQWFGWLIGLFIIMVPSIVVYSYLVYRK